MSRLDHHVPAFMLVVFTAVFKGVEMGHEAHVSVRSTGLNGSAIVVVLP